MFIETFCDIPGSMAIAWTCYLGFVSYVTGSRILMRRKYKIEGNIIEGELIIITVIGGNLRFKILKLYSPAT